MFGISATVPSYGTYHFAGPKTCNMHTGLQANCVPAQILEVISYFIEARMCGQFGSRLTEPSKRLDSRLLRSHTLCELLFCFHCVLAAA